MWTLFWGHVQGNSHPPKYIFVEVREEEAVYFFKRHFGFDPFHVSDQWSDSGPDYSAFEAPTLEAASGQLRNCKWAPTSGGWYLEEGVPGCSPYIPLAEFVKDPQVLVFPATEVARLLNDNPEHLRARIRILEDGLRSIAELARDADVQALARATLAQKESSP